MGSLPRWTATRKGGEDGAAADPAGHRPQEPSGLAAGEARRAVVGGVGVKESGVGAVARLLRGLEGGQLGSGHQARQLKDALERAKATP